jgi:hypothetical protein
MVALALALTLLPITLKMPKDKPGINNKFLPDFFD